MDRATHEACLLPVDCMLQDLPLLELDAEQVTRISQGQRLVLDRDLADGKIRLYDAGIFIGMGRLQGRLLAPERLLAKVAKNAALRQIGLEQ